jgi:hypothetical protein
MEPTLIGGWLCTCAPRTFGFSERGGMYQHQQGRTSETLAESIEVAPNPILCLSEILCANN